MNYSITDLESSNTDLTTLATILYSSSGNDFPLNITGIVSIQDTTTIVSLYKSSYLFAYINTLYQINPRLLFQLTILPVQNKTIYSSSSHTSSSIPHRSSSLTESDSGITEIKVKDYKRLDKEYIYPLYSRYSL